MAKDGKTKRGTASPLFGDAWTRWIGYAAALAGDEPAERPSADPHEFWYGARPAPPPPKAPEKTPRGGHAQRPGRLGSFPGLRTGRRFSNAMTRLYAKASKAARESLASRDGTRDRDE